MSALNQVIADLRSKSGISRALFARMLGISDHRLIRLERGDIVPEPGELQRVAEAFGVRVKDLQSEIPASAPLADLYLRSTEYRPSRGALHQLVQSGSHIGLGRFFQTVRDLAELEQLSHRVTAGELPESARAASALEGATSPMEQGVRLAAIVRDLLDLGAAPVPSMVELLQNRLDVAVFWTTPDELDPAIDGASASEPRPSALVNLVGGAQCWWRTRMTLAHELCHLLLDHGAGTPSALVSPSHGHRRGPRTGWTLFEGFDDLEVRADAFAAEFLVPAAAIQEVFTDADPTTSEGVSEVAVRFGVGRTVAINRISDVFNLSAGARARLDRLSVHWEAQEHEDERAAAPGIRGGLVRDAAIEAYANSLLSATRVRGVLGLSAADWIPEHTGLAVQQRKPLKTPSGLVFAAGARWLELNGLGYDLCLSEPRRTGRDWTVELASPTGGRVATLRIGFDLVVEGPPAAEVRSLLEEISAE